MCDFVNIHDDLIRISTVGEYRVVMRKVSKVIIEANNTEPERRQTTIKKSVRKQRLERNESKH